MQEKYFGMQKYARKAVLAIIALLVALPLATANARWLEKKEPNLPFGVYIQGLNGSVVLSLMMDKSGHVTSTSVLRSSGHPALDELARNAAMRSITCALGRSSRAAGARKSRCRAAARSARARSIST